ncbi:MAG: FecR domain-containing protein, partial [Planctomycetaceae bacterium]|nr:FecR domain-containing protein [Planctomycetaceae bacterium]
RLRLDGVALVELAPQTSLQVRTWAADGSGEAVLELSRGGVRIVTAPDFAPRKLRVVTPEAEVSIVGTEFGVDVIENMGTCVCCTHGAIDVRSRIVGNSSRVLEGGMALCFASGAAPMLGDIESEHANVVTALRRYAWPRR